MKAKRLARLMRDPDAQTWLDLEIRGYPEGFNTSRIGTCLQYAVAGGRVTTDGKYLLESLPEYEAKSQSDAALLDAMKSSRTSTTKAKDFVEKRATEALMVSREQIRNSYKQAFVKSRGRFASLKSAVHSYATDIYLAIELGDAAQDIFENAREDVDSFVRAHAPKAAEQLVAINERMQQNDAESRSSALTSCRRLLMTVADSIFPPQNEPWRDSSGKQRNVGSEAYKNRLLAYVDSKTESGSSQAIIESDISHLAARLDAVYEKACKGVHADVSEEEARLAVIHTYLLIAEIARLS